MTVAELMKVLSVLEPDRPVIVHGREDTFDDVDVVFETFIRPTPPGHRGYYWRGYLQAHNQKEPGAGSFPAYCIE